VLHDGSAAVLAGSSLYRLDSRASVVWRHDGLDWLGANADGDDLYVVSDRGELLRLASDGSSSRSVRLGASASAPPAIAADGTVFVPSDSGDVFAVSPDGSVRSIRVASAPLHRPVIDANRHRILVTAGDGTLTAVTLSD
jgi:outer membrane protein assembly factor BamB